MHRKNDLCKKAIINKKVEAVIFDIGDTLIAATDIAQRALLYTAVKLQKHGLIKNHGNFCEIYRIVDRRTEGVNVNHLYSGIRILSSVADALNMQKRHLFYYRFLSIYRDKVRTLIINSHYNVKNIFVELKNKNIKIGILSNGTTYEQL
ncbi:MAG: hypothetical protein LBK94_02315 [Prevotellaceae bacterium]|jgi:FMN phosphatase YigB (HAD superfamily)|nr:hypothetical protein [Prevotellaceae bacterium]